MSWETINEALDRCIEELEGMTDEQKEQFAQDYERYHAEQHKKGIEEALQRLDAFHGDKTISTQAKRIVEQLDVIPHEIEMIDDKVIFLVFAGAHNDALELELDYEHRIMARVRVPDENGIFAEVAEGELPAFYERFLLDTLKTWKEYRLRPFKAIQWNGDNIEDVQMLIQADPDSACWVETKQLIPGGSEVNILHVETNIYYENTPTGQIVYPGDYIVSWGDRFKMFRRRFFNDFFEEVE